MVFKAQCCSCEVSFASVLRVRVCGSPEPLSSFQWFVWRLTCLCGKGRTEYWLWGEERTDSSAAPGSWWGKKEERMNHKRVNWGELSIINLKDNGKASLPQNKNSEANKTCASPYYNLFVDLSFFFPPPLLHLSLSFYMYAVRKCVFICVWKTSTILWGVITV